ncbi:hypothetical protein FPRO05_10138 [Fusarium proliferatum]|uniref:Uncharacterized protein n=1 Tax=Gibberella intermedia TaxID=948311 RepID=A0A365NEG2_GIBIN|nr:hypothetical protein FPRO05_10138 [Fusarium proliferatum]
MSVITYTNNYSRVFHHKGVDVSPDEHAAARVQEYRVATVEACKHDPDVGHIQYGTVTGDGVGNQWAIVFNEEKYNIIVHYDDKTKTLGKRKRKIGYTLQLTVVQECRPMLGNAGDKPPRRIGVSLV